MDELGQWLREAREALGLSLAEVEANTRIRQKFLAALESEEWDALPGQVTARGFLRRYADFLGLDPDEAMARYQRALSHAPRLSEEEPESHELPIEREVDYRPIEVNLDEPPAYQLPWRLIAGIVAVAIALFGGWWLSTYQPGWTRSLYAFLPGQTPTLTADDIRATIQAQPTLTKIVIRVTATPTPTSDATTTPLPMEPSNTSEAVSELATPSVDNAVQPAAEMILLSIDITQRAWVRVRVDGEDRLEAILEPGEQGQWEALDAVSLRTGNAAGVAVTVNGEQRTSLGGSGEVVELLWTLRDGRVVEATPIPAATPTPAPTAGDDTAPASSSG